MSWIVLYEKPPMRGIKQVQYSNLDEAMEDVKMALLAGQVIRGIDRGRALIVAGESK